MKGPPEREPTGPRINEHIRTREVRLIDENGENVGVMATIDARVKANDVGLDLVEISPDANPPVCKILDFANINSSCRRRQPRRASTRRSSNSKRSRCAPASTITTTT